MALPEVEVYRRPVPNLQRALALDRRIHTNLESKLEFLDQMEDLPPQRVTHLDNQDVLQLAFKKGGRPRCQANLLNSKPLPPIGMLRLTSVCELVHVGPARSLDLEGEDVKLSARSAHSLSPHVDAYKDLVSSPTDPVLGVAHSLRA